MNVTIVDYKSGNISSVINSFREVGIDLPIIQFNPIDDVNDSFELLTKTFSGVPNE